MVASLYVGVHVSARRGSAVELSICVARALLPPGGLSMVEALCGLGKNRTVQS